MKAIYVTEFGDANVLKLKDIPQPKPKAGEVLVKLKAAGLNFIDIYKRTGLHRVSPTLPYVPGLEGAGIVEEIGEGVSEFKPGDRVSFTGGNGTYAEYCTVKAALLIPLPQSLSFEQGAAMTLQGITAHYLVHDYYHITRGSNVLMHAAAGGVGLLVIQYLKHLGARVIGTVSSKEKAQIALTEGADDIINYTEQDFVAESKKLTDGKGVDYIIDGVGKTTFTKDLDAVRTRGTICIFGSASGPAEPLAPNSLQARSITVCGGNLMNLLDVREELLARANDIIKGIEEGWLNLRINHVLPLEKAAEAQHLLESRQTTGKVILKISD